MRTKKGEIVLDILTIHGVRGFIDGNGTPQLNLEDVARGLGFTDKNPKVQSMSNRIE